MSPYINFDSTVNQRRNDSYMDKNAKIRQQVTTLRSKQKIPTYLEQEKTKVQQMLTTAKDTVIMRKGPIIDSAATVPALADAKAFPATPPAPLAVCSTTRTCTRSRR